MWQSLLKMIVLLGMGAFLFTRVTSGTIHYYINERFVILTWLAAIGFLLVGLSYWRGRQTANEHDDHVHEHNHEHDHEHDHDHNHNHGELTWLGLLIVAVPLVLGVLVQPQPLGAAAMGNRELNLASSGGLASLSPPDAGAAVGADTRQRNILDWLSEFQRTGDPAQLDGQEAELIGFVYRDERFGENMFMVSRFTISCCVADATPVGLMVRSEDASLLPTDQWVEVRGHFEVGRFNGVEMPILIADEIVKTDPPAQPYLYL